MITQALTLDEINKDFDLMHPKASACSSPSGPWR
jgi:hypothetical protein